MSRFTRLVRRVNRLVAKVDPVAKNMPEFQMQKKAFEAGNWDRPFGPEASGWDFLGASPAAQVTSGGKPVGGVLDPNDPKDRATGRAVGTLIADYWTGGAFSQIFAPKPGGTVTPTTGTNNPINFGAPLGTPMVTGTQSFAAEASSVTPAQAQQAAQAAQFKRWGWYALALIGALVVLKKFNLLKGL